MPASSKRRSGQKRSRTTIRELSTETLSVGKHNSCKNLTECTSYEVESVEPTRIRRKDKHDYNDDSSQQHDHCVPHKEHPFQETISPFKLDTCHQYQQQPKSLSTLQTLDVLPDCIIGACFFEGYLDTMEIITSISLVSQRMRQIGRETVKSLDLRKCPKLRPDDLKILVNTFYNLTNLDFSYTRQFSDDHLIQLSKLTKTLRKLHLKGSKVTDKGLILYLEQSAKNYNGQNYLEEIDISAISKLDSSQIGDESVIAISKYCPNLRLLNLGWCQRVSDISTVPLSKLKHIEHLDLSLTSISSESCFHLSQLSTLKSLRLDATNICRRGLESLFTARKMILPKINSDSDDTMMKWNAHFRNLETLSLRFLDDLDLDRLEILIRFFCNHLKSIDLTHSLGTSFVSSHHQAITKLAERGIAVKMAFY